MNMGTYVGKPPRQGSRKSIAILLVLFVLAALAVGYSVYRRHQAEPIGQPVPAVVPFASASGVAEGDSAQIWVPKLNAALAREDWIAAEALLRKLIDRFPSEGNYWRILGQVLLKQDKGGEALVHLQKAVSLGVSDSGLSSWMELARSRAQEEAEYGQLHSAHFDLAAEGGRGFGSATGLFRAMETEYDRVSLALNHYPANRLKAVVKEGDTLGSGIPDWTGALFDGVIRIPLSLAENPATNSRVLRHEIAHAFIRDLGGEKVPTWFDEGAAQSLEGARIDTALLASDQRPPTLQELDGNFLAHSSRADARRLYQWSLAMIAEAMGRGSGYAGVHAVLAHGRASGDFYQAFQSEFGISAKDLLDQTAARFAMWRDNQPTNDAVAESSSVIDSDTETQGKDDGDSDNPQPDSATGE